MPSSTNSVAAAAVPVAAPTASSSSASASSSSGTVSSLPNNMSLLQQEQPQLYNLLVQANFMQFMKQNNAAQARIHKLHQDAQNQT